MSDTNAIKWLRAQGVAFDILEYEWERIGAEHSAEAVGRPLEMVCKTLIVAANDRTIYAAIVPGDQRFDSRKLAAAVGKKSADLVDPEEAERITGYKVGGISPFAMRRKLPTLIEESALALDRLIVNGGRRGVLVEMATGELVRLTKAMMADL